MTMTIRHLLVFLAFAFALPPLVLPARQLAVEDIANFSDRASPEAAAVLELVKNLHGR
ncbi:MAG: hypothetical protein IID51_08260 [Proteobacteria bacterium]|nr:hypothetical protein [Pseudomonadota bacterium]